jgi:hypothetical protein
VLGGQWLTKAGGVFLARTVPPPGFARVRHEHHRPHHTVGERVGIAIGVIGLRAFQTVGAALVPDERDRAVVAAERRAGQRQPAGRVVECLPDRVAPALGVPAVVDLVEYDQRLAVLRAHSVPTGVAGHLGVGDDDAVILVGVLRRRVAELGVQRHPDPGGGLRPLDLEVLGGDHDGDSLDDALGQKFTRDAQRKRGLACSRGRHRKKVARSSRQIPDQSPTLPAPQRLGAGRCESPHPKTPIWSKGSLGQGVPAAHL